MGVSIFRGSLDKATVTLTIGDDGPTLSGSADVESISIREPEHLRQHVLGDDFLAAEQHPTITFNSEKVALNDDGTARVTGQLAIRGHSGIVTASGHWAPPTVDPMGNRRSHLSLAAEINRRDYGMTWDTPLPGGGSALGDTITLSVELALIAAD